MKIIMCAYETPAHGKRKERKVPKETETTFRQLQNGQEAWEKTDPRAWKMRGSTAPARR